MHSFVDEIDIEAPSERVWRAITRPSEVVIWDGGIVEPLDAPPDYPRAGQHVRWRYRLGPLPMTLHDRPIQVEEGSVLRSFIHLGPFDLEETYTIHAEEIATTRLRVALSLSSAVPLLGIFFERVIGPSLARSTVRGSLADLKRHCEGTP